MPNTHTTLGSLFSDIADAIRSKTGDDNTIKADNFPDAISDIDLGTDTSDATGTAADLLSGKTMYGASGKVTGIIPTHTSSEIFRENNTVYIPSGCYSEGLIAYTVGTRKEAETYTPGTTDQTIPSDYYLTGAQTIKGDANLVAANIKKDVEIFGVTGTYEGATKQTLFAPTISILQGILTIDSTSNGDFAEGFYIYANGNLIATVRETTIALSEYADNGDIITVKAYATNFNDSPLSNSVEYSNVPIGVNWATDSWASIKETSKQGKTAEIYGSQVGATREITLTNGNTMTIRLSNATDDMYSLSDGSRTTGLCVEFVDCFPDKYMMNSTSTNVGGWNACQMRTVTMAQLYDLLPAGLKAVIATVDIKASEGGSSASKVLTSQDKLFLLAEREIFATRSYSLQAEWDALTRWQWYADHDTDADRIKKRNGSANSWWERSAYAGSSNFFCGVASSGNAGGNGAGNSGGVSPAFCI